MRPVLSMRSRSAGLHEQHAPGPELALEKRSQRGVGLRCERARAGARRRETRVEARRAAACEQGGPGLGQPVRLPSRQARPLHRFVSQLGRQFDGRSRRRLCGGGSRAGVHAAISSTASVAAASRSLPPRETRAAFLNCADPAARPRSRGSPARAASSRKVSRVPASIHSFTAGNSSSRVTYREDSSDTLRS